MAYSSVRIANTAGGGVARADKRGIGPAPYHLQDKTPPSILLGFSGLSEAESFEGIKRLAAVLAQVLARLETTR